MAEGAAILSKERRFAIAVFKNGRLQIAFPWLREAKR
jgi:hypothetical protein